MFVAAELKATNRPSRLIFGVLLAPFGSMPSGPVDTRVVVGTQPAAAPTQVSRTKMSVTPFASPRTRLFASEAKATNLPFALTEGLRLAPFGSVPSKPTETGMVTGEQLAGAPWQVSRRKTLLTPDCALDGSTAVVTKGKKRCGPTTLEGELAVFMKAEEVAIWELDPEDNTMKELFAPVWTTAGTPFTLTTTGTVTDEAPFKGTVGTVTARSVPLQLVTVAATPPTVTVLAPCVPPK